MTRNGEEKGKTYHLHEDRESTINVSHYTLSLTHTHTHTPPGDMRSELANRGSLEDGSSYKQKEHTTYSVH